MELEVDESCNVSGACKEREVVLDEVDERSSSV